MIYHLASLLQGQFSPLNVLQYISFRAMSGFLLAFAVVLAVQPAFIRWLKALGVQGQPIRNDGPKDHEIKQGTPTMGGAVMVGAVLLATLLLCDLSNFYVWITTGVLVAFGALGFADDWRKVTKQNSKGLSERQKLLWQFAIAGGAAFLLYISGFLSNLNFPTTLNLPFLKGVAIPLGIFFILFAAIVIVGTSNAVNLTDGLDGLAIGPVMTVAFTLAVFCYVSGRADYSTYLGFPHLRGTSEIAIILSSLIGAGLGFLWYNTSPAQVFMGDLGALALGGLLGWVAVLVKQELLLVIAGGIFVIEALSVLAQRYYYKATGKRIFKMAPIHHHFELLGWAEQKITVRFWIISIVLALISLTSLKLR